MPATSHMGHEQENSPSRPTLEIVTQLARESLLRDGNHVPTLIAQGSLNFIVAGLEDLDNTHEGRVRQMGFVGFALGQRDEIGTLEQVYFISEAWMSTGKGKMPDHPPSEDPSRKEVLIIYGLSVKEREAELVLLEMIRDRGGQLIEIKEFPHTDVDNMTVESPLLTTFVAAYEAGMRGKKS